MFAFNLHEFGDFNDTNIPKPVIDLKTQDTLREYYAIKLKTLRTQQKLEDAPIDIPPLLLEAEVTDQEAGIVRNIPTPVLSPRTLDSTTVTTANSQDFDDTQDILPGEATTDQETANLPPETGETHISSAPSSPKSPQALTDSPEDGDAASSHPTSPHGEDGAEDEEMMIIVPVIAHTDAPLRATAPVPVSSPNSAILANVAVTSGETTAPDANQSSPSFPSSSPDDIALSDQPIPLSLTPLQFSTTRAEIVAPPVSLAVVHFPAPAVTPQTPVDDLANIERMYGEETAPPPTVCGHYASAPPQTQASNAFSSYTVSFSPSSAPPPCTMQEIPQHINQILYLRKQTQTTPENLSALREYVMELHTEYLNMHKHLVDTHTAAENVTAYAVDRYAECQALRESHTKAAESYRECHKAWETAVDVRKSMEEERQVLNEQYGLCYKTMLQYKEDAKLTHEKLIQEHEKLTNLHNKFQTQTLAAQSIQASLHALEHTHSELRETHNTTLDRVDELEKACAYKEKQCEGLRTKLQELNDEVGLLSQQHDTQFFQMTSMNNEATEYRRAIDGLNRTISELHDTGKRDRHSHARVLTYVLCSSLVKRHRLHKVALKGIHALAKVRSLITGLNNIGVLLPEDLLLLNHMQTQYKETLARVENVRNPRFTVEMLVKGVEDLSEPISALTERLEHLSNLNKAFFARNTMLASKLIDNDAKRNEDSVQTSPSLPQISSRPLLHSSTHSSTRLHDDSQTFPSPRRSRPLGSHPRSMSTSSSSPLETNVNLPLIRNASTRHGNFPSSPVPIAPGSPVNQAVGSPRVQRASSRANINQTTDSYNNMTTSQKNYPYESKAQGSSAKSSVWSTPKVQPATATVPGLSSAPVIDTVKSSMISNAVNLKIN